MQKIFFCILLAPFATGLLIVGVGREATKRLSEFLKKDKTYRAVINLGATSTTDDLKGEITENKCEIPTEAGVKEVLQKFMGEIEQLPPVYSAIKQGGTKAYELARKGIEPERKLRGVRIYSIELLRYEFPEVEIETKVSSGTYIRALGRDIGEALGCGGYLTKLERTAIERTYNLCLKVIKRHHENKRGKDGR